MSDDTRMAVTPRVALVGAGVWGHNLARTFSELGVLGAVCDVNEASARAVAIAFRTEARGFEDILADPAISAVAVASPAHSHAEVTEAVLRRGKHVFVEKPLSLRPADAAGLTKLADDHGLTLMVGHLLQYHSGFTKLKELADAGTLGRLQYVYSTRLNLGRFRREENILWSFAPHDISMILALSREEPTKVSAVGSYVLHPTIADVTITHLAFPSGLRGHIFVSWLHPYKEQRLVVIGSDGMAVFDDGMPWPEKLSLYPHKVDWRDGFPEPSQQAKEPVALERREPLYEECAHFIDCVATGRRPRTDGREGLRVLRVLDAAQSSLTGSTRTSDLATAAIHETAWIDDDVVIGARTRIWHFSHILSGTKVGPDCTIGQNVAIGPKVTIGSRCKIQNNVSIYNGVIIEDDVFCGPSCVFTNVLTPRAEVDRSGHFSATLVRRGSSIGANATILCGVTLGKYCMVGAGAVVTKDVAPHSLVVGVPARHIGWVSHDGERLGENMTCPRSGRRYRLSESGSLEEVLQ